MSDTRPVPEGALFLVDGTYTVFRSFYAISRLTAPDGTPTNAVYGFIATVRKILRDWKPRHLGIAFDLEGPTHRDTLYAEYKAHRPPPPEDLVPQFELARDAARALGWPIVERAGYEADDVIASLASQARADGRDVVIVTADKDLYQLVGERIHVLNPAKNDLLMDPEGVREVFGVRPEHVADVLALMGDQTDNVPGVPGIGEKTAKALIARYGGIEPVLARAKLFDALWRGREQALAVLEADDTAGLRDAVAALRDLAARLAEIERAAGGDQADDLAARFEAVAGLASDAEPRAIAKVLRELEKKTQPKTWLALVEHEQQARLSRQLVDIPLEIGFPLDLEALRFDRRDASLARDLFQRLGFRTLTKEMEEEAANSEPAVASETRAADALLVEILDSREKLVRWVEGAARATAPLAFDTETDSLDARHARLVGISLALGPGSGAYVPVGHRGEGAQVAWDEAREILAPLFADRQRLKVGQNSRFDLAVLRAAGIAVAGPLFDTLIAAQLLEPGGLVSNRLDDLARRYLGESMIAYREVSKTDKGEVTLDLVPIPDVARYAVEDAVVAWRLREVLAAELERERLTRLFADVEGPLVAILEEMEATGIRVDVGMLTRMSIEMEQELLRLEREIHALAGHAFNIKSPQQLRTVLFEELGLAPAGRRTQKTKEHSTGQEVLEALAVEHPLPAKVLEYRELAKLQGTYLDALPKLVDGATGRVHTRFHQLGAATGRLSSSDPNLQNIPIRTPAGKRIREAFVPEAGCVFVSADYSQMELRILAHLADDPGLIEAFRDDRDIHAATAAAVMGVPQGDVTPDMRARAKAVNFGIIYGMSEFRLAREQGMSRDEAHAFIEAYFARYSRVQEYVASVHAEVQQTGMVRTLLGRLRRFRELVAGAEGARSGLNRALRDGLLRQAVNTTVQGSGADIVKLAMVNLHRELRERGLRARLVLQVHDELLLEVPDDEVEACSALVRTVMEGVVDLAVPLRVDVRAGRTWSDAH